MPKEPTRWKKAVAAWYGNIEDAYRVPKRETRGRGVYIGIGTLIIILILILILV